MSEFIENKFKSVSTEELESTLSKAMSLLIGQGFEVTIGDIKYGGYFEPTKMSISVKHLLDESMVNVEDKDA